MGISVLIAESNLVKATKVADRLYAIGRGEMILEGSPQAVVEQDQPARMVPPAPEAWWMRAAPWQRVA
jgi:ABC-type lipopolysaccharide export system ATPase subunit